jgi:hypothetical protein
MGSVSKRKSVMQEYDIKQQKQRAIKMIVIGFAGPTVTLILLFVITGIINTVTNSMGGSSATDIITTIKNIVFLVVGIFAVSGFIWGPILGIYGIVKLTKLNKTSTSTNTQTQINNLNTKGDGENNVT